ncbi:hypothetical protein HHK36_013056 [Tetracentron sinense]|uniref:Uncharacterized protein n=1 Tax=Tetracentron sinense TaxID=13715 RepID=A0A834Z701_TETSI|nr:hypothetical protein HHK36_013056 [Tetracentron sinense]
MESADLYRASSLRRNSSLWRSSNVEVFSRSSRDEEDDEEALKWAALEKLPTYNRLKRGILTAAGGQASEIDIDNLGIQEKKDLIERLVRVAEEDNEKFLLKLKNCLDWFSGGVSSIPSFSGFRSRDFGGVEENENPSWNPRFLNGCSSSRSGFGKRGGDGGGKREMDPVAKMVLAIQLLGERFLKME